MLVKLVELLYHTHTYLSSILVYKIKHRPFSFHLRFMAFQIGLILTALAVASLNSVNGQVTGSCTTSMMSTFTPCANIITGSTNNNGLMPPSTCCDSLRSLMTTNTDCACLLVSAYAPFFQLPITQALSLSFSQACNINGLPLHCKGLHLLHFNIFPFSFLIIKLHF